MDGHIDGWTDLSVGVMVLVRIRFEFQDWWIIIQNISNVKLISFLETHTKMQLYLFLYTIWTKVLGYTSETFISAVFSPIATRV